MLGVLTVWFGLVAKPNLKFLFGSTELNHLLGLVQFYI